MEVEDYLLLETRLRLHSGGNPGAILDRIARLRKEPLLTCQVVRELVPAQNEQQVSLAPFGGLAFLGFLALRYVGSGMGDQELYILAGIGMVATTGLCLLLGRPGGGGQRR
jgi:hypothetical protein